MASKQAANKAIQGYTKEGPKCCNCIHFRYQTEQRKSWTGARTYTHEYEFRCGLGGFKAGKSAWCKEYKAP